MKRQTNRVVVAAAVVGAALLGREALSSTSVTGIPGDCQMSVWRLRVDGAGKAVGEPVSLAEAKMIGSWTPRAFRRSWDGKVVLAHTFEGFRVSKGADVSDHKAQFMHRNFWWGPDNKKFMFWAPAGVAVANADDLGPAGQVVKHKIVYHAPAGRFPVGIAWSPSGQDVLVSEHYEKGLDTHSAIERVPLDGGAATPILDHDVELLFYMPADTWYEDGSGPKAKSPILFGAKDGLWVMDSDGSNKTKLCEVPCEGVADVMWDPSQKDQFLLMWRRGYTGPNKKEWKGLYLFHVEAAKKIAAAKKTDDWSFAEQITDTMMIHTLFFSPKGKYVAWADPEAVSYRETAKSSDKPTKVVIPGATGALKGFTWDDKETRLAVAVANKLFIYDLATKAATQVASTSERGFIAEPFWRGEDLVYSTFVDASDKKKLEEPKPPK